MVLCVGAFTVSLLVVADILPGGDLTEALVISALMGCVVLVAAPAWRRFGGQPVHRDR